MTTSIFDKFLSIFFLNKYSDKSYQDDTILQEGLNNLTFSSSFSSGYSGLFWMIAHLENKDLLNIDRDIFDEFDKVIEDFIAYKDFSEYDFLHGDLGITPYLIERKDSKNLNIVFDKLMDQKKKYESFFVWEERFSHEEFTDSKINLSLSHGNASILALANITFSEGILVEKMKVILKNYLGFYQSLFFEKNNSTFLPSFIIDGKPVGYEERLAWCYGDFGVLYQLLWSSQLIKDKEIEIQVTNYLLHLATFREDKGSCSDACLCHGSAGAAYMFHKIYEKTKNKEFLIAKDYWNIDADSLLKENNNQFFYNSKWNEDKGLLNGLTGVKFAQETMKGNIDSGWDRCLLLS